VADGDHRAGALTGFFTLLRRSPAFRYGVDRVSLKIPIVGNILEKATIARWTRTLATMFAAGVPLVESLDAVAGAAGNRSTHARPSASRPK
jgi:type IV pilus assembly protein PilC